MNLLGLQKVLNVMLKEEFPDIESVKVSNEVDENSKMVYYNVYVIIDIPKTDSMVDNMRDSVMKLSKYILAPNERIQYIRFSNPSTSRSVVSVFL